MVSFLGSTTFHPFTGIIQQHLTKKIVNTDANYLTAWSNEAFDLIDDVLNDALKLDRTLHTSRMIMPTRSDPDLEECLMRASRLKAKVEVTKKNL